MTKKKSLFGFVKKVRDFLFPTKKALACVSETWESLQVYTTTKNVSFKPFVELKQLACPAHSCLGGKLIDSIQPFHSHTKSVVLRIGRQGAYFAHNHLLDSAHNVIYHPFVQFSQLPISNKNLPRNVKKKRGTIAYLSNTAADHYGHWLRLILPMLRLYAKEVDLADIDCFYVGDVPIKPFMQETLEMFGILPAKILNYPCTSDMILIACNRWEIQEKNRYLDWESANFVKQGILSHLLAKQTAPLSVEVLHNCCYAPRIYVSRGNVNWRKVVNEEEVLTLMKKYDFECRILDKISVEEQFKIFYFACSWYSISNVFNLAES